MPSPLSVDLRERVVAFVLGGASCREAATRFGLSAASASRWSARLRKEGRVAPKPMGGDQLSHRLEAHAGLILAICRRKPALFLRELRDHLAGRGVRTSTSSLSRFFARHGISRKRMARPVYKRFLRSDLASLHQRIRSQGRTLAKMEIRASRAS